MSQDKRDHIERKRADIARIEGRHGYCAEAVNKAIAASNRHGRPIGPREANAIHRRCSNWQGWLMRNDAELFLAVSFLVICALAGWTLGGWHYGI